MDQIRPMNGPMNLYSQEVFFIILCFSPAMGLVGGGGGGGGGGVQKMFQNDRKYKKVSLVITSQKKHPIVIIFGMQV